MNNILPSPLVPYNRYVLDNGVRVITKPVPSAPAVAVDVWTATGAGTEPLELQGISHFYEHMFFKGTAKRPVGQMDLEVKALGGYNNAATGYDYTHYYIVLPVFDPEPALDLLSDALCNTEFPPDEIERERQVVIEEISRMEDSPSHKLYTDFLCKIFEDTPYGHQVLGTPESLAGIGQKEFLEFRNKGYHPERLTVVITGNINNESALKCADKYFGSIVPQGKPDKLPEESFKIKNITEKQIILYKDVQQAYTIMGFATPSFRGLDDEYALDVVSTLLGEGRSSRLYQNLQEDKGIVSSTGSDFWLLRNAGVFFMESTCDPEDLDKVRSEMLMELQNLIDGNMSEKEIEKSKQIICNGFLFSNEKSGVIAHTLGQYETVATLEEAENYLTKISEVTKDQIQSAMSRYLPPEKIIEVLILPKGVERLALATD